MFTHWEWNKQSTYRAEVAFRSLVTLAVQLLVLELCCTLLACLLVLLPMCLLAVHAAVFDEKTGVAVLELDDVAFVLVTVGAGFSTIFLTSKRAVHCAIDARMLCKVGVRGVRWGRSERRRFRCVVHHISLKESYHGKHQMMMRRTPMRKRRWGATGQWQVKERTRVCERHCCACFLRSGRADQPINLTSPATSLPQHSAPAAAAFSLSPSCHRG